MQMIHRGAILSALSLAGCSSGRDIAVMSSGTMPVSGVYTMIGDTPGDAGQSVSYLLEQRGLRKAEAPDYIVQVSYAERPAGAGLLVPNGQAAQWLRSPDLYRKKRAIATLGISIAEAAHGRELYRASASGRLRSKVDGWAPLLQAIFPAPAQNGD